MELHPHRSRRRRGFSIVELLVVVAIIVALLGILLVALNTAARRAQAANSQFLLSSISQAIVRFENDIGYLPPILRSSPLSPPTVASSRDLLQPPNWAVVSTSGVPTQVSIDAWQEWHSHTALPEYLLGYGDRTADGYGAFGPLPATPAGSPGAKETPTLGLRSPGPDGVWGALLNPRAGTPGNGTLVSRNNVNVSGAYTAGNVNPVAISGKVYGPYLDLKDASLLGAISGFDVNGEPIIVRPDEVTNFDALPKVLLDYWGSPIHYYRAGYALGDLRGPDPTPVANAGVRPITRDLGDIFALRPYEFSPNESAVGVNDANGDGSTLTRLKAGRWALMSRGPDKAWNRAARRDEESQNRDNLVEVGQ